MFRWQVWICKGKVIGFGVCWVFAFLGSRGCIPSFSKLSRIINQLQSTVLYNPCICYTPTHVMSATCWQNYLQDYLYSKSLTIITAFVLLEPLFWFWELVLQNCLTVDNLNNLRMCTQSFSFKNLGPLLFSHPGASWDQVSCSHPSPRRGWHSHTPKIKICRAVCCSHGQQKLGGHLQSPAMGRQDVPFYPRA